MRLKEIAIGLLLIATASCKQQHDEANNTMNVDENLTTTGTSAATTTDMNATDLNASASPADDDNTAPPGVPGKH